MSFQTKYLGMSPFHAPSLFTILAFLEYEHGIFHARGGLGSITPKLAKIAERFGAKIRTSTPVKELIYEGKTVVGVKLEDETIYADKVVVNADFAHAMTTLVPDEKRKKWSNKNWKRVTQPSCYILAWIKHTTTNLITKSMLHNVMKKIQ